MDILDRIGQKQMDAALAERAIQNLARGHPENQC